MPVEVSETRVDLWDSRLVPVLWGVVSDEVIAKEDELEGVNDSAIVDGSTVDRAWDDEEVD